MGIEIIGSGKYLPERLVTNEEFTKIVDTSDEWITTRTGIKTRHVAIDCFTWEMGARAAEQAVKNAGISVEEIGLIVASTCTGDYSTPSLSCLVANALGIAPVCIDVNCACAGFVTALDAARRYLDDAEYKTALVVSSEMLTKITDYSDRSTCVLFGDGAGAVLLRKKEGLFVSEMGSDPTGGQYLFGRGVAPNEQFRDTPFDRNSDGFPESNGYALYQDGRQVYKFATRILPYAVEKACEKAGITPDELRWIFPHQANQRIIETAAKNLKQPLEKFFINIGDHGNMSSACIPICLAEAMEQGILSRGDKICTVGFGGGLVYAAAVFEW